METKDCPNALRSEEVQEMMGEVPSWITRWGITLIGVLLVGLCAGSYFFKYPDTLSASVIIKPNKNGRPTGVASLPSVGAGKAAVGQTVRVRLDNYPDAEYGYVTGVVKKIASVPTQDHTYELIICFPLGLITSYGQHLPANIEMVGTAEIVVRDKRLIENLVQPLESLIR